MYKTTNGISFNLSDIILYSKVGNQIFALIGNKEQLQVYSSTGLVKDAPIGKFDYSEVLEKEIIANMKKINRYTISDNYIKVIYSDGFEANLSKDNLEIIERLIKLQNNPNKKDKNSFKNRWKKDLSAVLAALTIYTVGSAIPKIMPKKEAATTTFNTEQSQTISPKQSNNSTNISSYRNDKQSTYSNFDLTKELMSEFAENNNQNDTVVGSEIEETVEVGKTVAPPKINDIDFNTIEFQNNELYVTDLSVYKNTGNFVVTAGNLTYSMSEEDKILFASIVAAEMGVSYSPDEALAICSVVLNRCEINGWCSSKTRDPLTQITYGSEHHKFEFEAYYNGSYKKYLNGAKTGNWDLKIANPEKFELAYKATEDALHGIRNNLKFTQFEAPRYGALKEFRTCDGGNTFYDNVPYDKRVYFGNPVVVPLSSTIILSSDGSIINLSDNVQITNVSYPNNKTWVIIDSDKNIHYYDSYEEAISEGQEIANNYNKTVDICINCNETIVPYLAVTPSSLIKK